MFNQLNSSNAWGRWIVSVLDVLFLYIPGIRTLFRNKNEGEEIVGPSAPAAADVVKVG